MSYGSRRDPMIGVLVSGSPSWRKAGRPAMLYDSTDTEPLACSAAAAGIPVAVVSAARAAAVTATVALVVPVLPVGVIALGVVALFARRANMVPPDPVGPMWMVGVVRRWWGGGRTFRPAVADAGRDRQRLDTVA